MAYGIWYDEVALWGDTDRFTALELAQMYEMGKNKRLPITDYTDTWDDDALSHSGYITAHTISVEPMSGDMLAFANAHLYQQGVAKAVLPYFPAITGKPYVEKMVYYLTGNGGEELVTGQTWTGTINLDNTEEGTGFVVGTSAACQSSAPYSVAGKANFTWHILTRDLSKDGGTATIGDVPSLSFRLGSSIRFRNGADWSGLAIAAFYAAVQDGRRHYVVVNISYVDFVAGSHRWLLKISVDGKPYVSYGPQTSGSSNPITTGGSPILTVTGTPASSYVDEVILWTDVDFTPDELAELGHAPPVVFSDGYAYLGNYEVPPSNDSYNYTVENLLVTHDHHPQIIGKLQVQPPEEVNIEVWACTGGTAMPLTLASSECYPIGTTGRWGWSTQNLPAWPNKHPQYFYRMTAGNGTVFEGVFILSTQRKYRGVPRSSSEFIVRRS